MPFCPSCQEEYVPGIAECADCDVPLVEKLAPPSEPEPEPIEEYEAAAGELERLESDDDSPVVVANTDSEAAADAVVLRLRQQMIPARVAGEGPFRIEVPAEFAERAQRSAVPVARGAGAGIEALALLAGGWLVTLSPQPRYEIDPLSLVGSERGPISKEDRDFVYASNRAIEQAGPEAFAAVIRVLFRGNRAMVGEAAKTLVRIGPRGVATAVEALAESIQHDLSPIRTGLASALAEAGIADRTSSVVPLADHTDPAVALRAVRALGELADPAVGPWILARVRRGGDSAEYREELADALWNMTKGKVDLDPDAVPEQLEADLNEIERRFGWTSS